ncbi:helix-turn-helix domain-containing protein [Rubritalea tangerina]|uniref:Helix-turn-helix domain-containing protein n=1 Tax=Rubritalea tangerina TaxID=430798 RepID=A0ABW4Z8R1_9BACT
MTQNKPTVATLLSPRYELSYRFHDALLELPWVAQRYAIQIIPYSPGDELMPDLSAYRIDGLITSLDADIENMAPLQALGVPVVNLAASRCEGISSLHFCPESLAQVVVRHAAGAGFEQVAFLPTVGMQSQEVEQGKVIQACASEAGLGYWQLSVEERPLGVSVGHWMETHSALVERLKMLDERTMIYAFHDWRAVTLVEVCKELGVSIPESVGILGRANSLDTKVGVPNISSINHPYLHMAQSAMELIQNGSPNDVRIACGEVVPRASTVSTPEQGNFALRLSEMIRSYGIEGISVDELAKLAGVSRSTLERHYREIHGEAPSVALKRVRMQHVERLLKSTDLTVHAIAEMVGFSSTRSFFTMFEKAHGVTPGRWRQMQTEQ